MKTLLVAGTIAVATLLFSACPQADEPRQERARHFDINASGALPADCNCSDGTPLGKTGALIFNCRCGPLQCVVVGAGTAQQAAAPGINCQ